MVFTMLKFRKFDWLPNNVDPVLTKLGIPMLTFRIFSVCIYKPNQMEVWDDSGSHPQCVYEIMTFIISSYFGNKQDKRRRT